MTSDAPQLPLLLDISAAARFVGVGSGVIRGWVLGGLPFVRAGRGGKKMFSPADLKRFVEKQKVNSTEERLTPR